MAGVGYAEGYLGALSQISGIQENQQQMQMRGLQIQQQRQNMQENQQEKSILADVFRNRADTDTTLGLADQNDKLVTQYQEAGRRLMGTSPKEALNFLKAADRLSHQNAGSRLELAKAEKLKGEYLATVASGVQDQDTLNEYVRRAAKDGQTVPAKYQTWNEATKNYLERAVLASMPISKQQDLALKTREIELKGQVEERRGQDERRKERLDTMREARLRDGLEIKSRAAAQKATATLGLRGEKEVEGEMLILKDLDKDSLFKKAPAGLQRQAAQDVHYRAQKILAESLLGVEEPVTKEEALDLARREVLGEFKEKSGGFFGKDTATRQKGGVEKKEEAVQKPAAVQQIKSDADYEKLPSGSTFLAPDGTTRRKP